MTRFPIVAHHRAAPPRKLLDRATSLAQELQAQQPELVPRDVFRPLVATSLDDAPALHLDDLSTIVQLDRFYDVSFLQDRARFRAADGDFVATCGPPSPEFESYCEERLGLGTVTWLRPRPRANPLGVAAACWTDREVRRSLVRACQHSRLRYLHPHMGNFPAWATALLLQRASRRPLSVIAPHPGLTKRVNNKLWFADVARRLFGARAIPPTAAAYNLATAAHLVQQLTPRSRSIVFKLPASAGGAGNLVIESRRLRGRALGGLRTELRARLAGLGWTGEDPLLVGSWQTDVLAAPSTQLWIPPEDHGRPIVEGVFQQLLEESQGIFLGSRAADLPLEITRELVDRSWVLGRLFQLLGYVGRCSFDLLLVGDRLSDCRVEFIECNGRWGGTSLPMSLMNRLFGDWARQPYATNECIVPGLQRISYGDILEYFASELYDARTGRGSLIFYNPGGLAFRPGIDVLVIAESWDAAGHRAQVEIPRRLRDLAWSAGVPTTGWAQIR